jgi:eukaryotic-like serine/threonine-protein kinase
MIPDDTPVVPRHRILRALGEGGMGIVYEAEQLEPVRRRVALKVLKVGMDTKAFVARFEAERQALAVMDHAGIARLYDAGSTAEGRPYYSMEYVPGLPLTDFCDEQRLDTRQRLELMIEVCDAVHHAHRQGIVHRDLKPSNILVSLREDRPVAKVIDFGIAKAMTGRLTERTFVTELNSPIGTPAYMSPEQWDAGPLGLDERTDIYSMGVILYELLVGTLPHEPRALAVAGAAASALLRDVTPLPPSTRFTTLGVDTTSLANYRRTTPQALVRELRGDVDWITMKALDPERAGRYATADALAMDLRRHLRSEPVTARPRRFGYRVGRFVRRHRLATAAAVLALPVVGVLAAQEIVDRRKGALQEQLRVELRQMLMAQETFWEKNKRYTSVPADLSLSLPDGVSVDIVYSSDTSWAGAASHAQLPAVKCVIGVGSSPLTRASPAAEGQPLCTENPELERVQER